MGLIEHFRDDYSYGCDDNLPKVHTVVEEKISDELAEAIEDVIQTLILENFPNKVPSFTRRQIVKLEKVWERYK